MTNSAKTIDKPFFSSRQPRKRVFKKVESNFACDIVGPISKGCEIFGLTKGQISIIEIIEYVLKATGPADVVISTWTAAQKSIDKAQAFIRSGSIKSLRFMIDPSFKARKPEFCDDLVDSFGSGCVRTIRNHAKFILISNDEWNIVIRTSMNLNQNPRMEYVEISDSKEMHNFMSSIVDEVFDVIPEEKHFARDKSTNESVLTFNDPESKSHTTIKSSSFFAFVQ